MKMKLRLLRKFVILGALLLAIGFVTFSSDSTKVQAANTCCSECFALEEQCRSEGHTVFECQQWYSYCFQTCIITC